HIKKVCDRFAAAGYSALAPDMYHGKTATEPDGAGKLFMALNIAQAEKDLAGAAKYLAGHSSTPKLGAVGFCMGGQLALFAGTTNPTIGAVVDFYGIHPNVKPDYSKLTGPVLGLFAEKDGFVTPQTARDVEAAIKKAGKAVSINIYPGVDHAFFNDERPDAYNKAAAEDAWKRTLAHFQTNRKYPRGGGRRRGPHARERAEPAPTWSGQQLGSLGRLFCYRSTRPMIALPDPTLGALCSLASALAWAVVSLLVRRLAGTLNSPTINALRTLGAGALLMTWVLVTEGVEGLLGIGLATFILLAVSIMLSGSLGDTIFFESARFLGLARAMTASMTYPMISAALAAMFLGEPVTPALIMGSVLTLGALALIVGERPSEPDRPGHLWLGLLTSQAASL